MKFIKFFILALTFAGQAAFANEIELKSMDCTLINGLGFPIGTASYDRSHILMSVGPLRNELRVQSVTDTAVIGMTPGRKWDYTFAFSEKLSSGSKAYHTIIYQQLILGFAGPPSFVAFANCTVSI